MDFSIWEHCTAGWRTFETFNGSHRAPIMMDFRDLQARKNVLMTLLHECAKNSAKNACQSGKEMVFCFQMKFSIWEHCAARRTFETINGSHRAPIMMDFRDLRARKNVLMTLLHECAKNSAKNACQSGKEMAFCFQNYSELLWEKIALLLMKFEAEQFILTVKGQSNFWNRMFFNLFPDLVN